MLYSLGWRVAWMRKQGKADNGPEENQPEACPPDRPKIAIRFIILSSPIRIRMPRTPASAAPHGIIIGNDS